MERLKNVPLNGSNGRPVHTDVNYVKNGKRKPVIIFCHGFKGFKDWGAFNDIADWFARQGFVFVKFNFSHNGTTGDKLTDFADLEAFGRNTFSYELNDAGVVLDWVLSDEFPVHEVETNLEKIFFIGHSRGGGIAILKASQDKRISGLATWASVSDFSYSWDEKRIEKWREKGVMQIENKRTNQKMPLYFSLYEDYKANIDKLHILSAEKMLKAPHLIIHGTEDEAVSFSHALELKKINQNAKLDLIPNGSHTFGVKHPHNEPHLPFDMQIVVEHTRDFLRSL